MSDKELIAGIISGDFNEKDVHFRCKEISIKAFYASLIEAECHLREKYSGMPVVSLNTDADVPYDYKLDAELTDNYYPDMTIEAKRQLCRIDDAIAIVEKYINDAQESKCIENLILRKDKQNVKNALKTLVNGKKGGKVAPFIAVAVNDGILQVGDLFNIIQKDLGVKGTKQAFNKAFGDYYDAINGKGTPYRKRKLDEARTALYKLLDAKD